jgi:hypothetical protein
MLDAARACVRFCCPGCGAGLRAPRADAGTALECHLCGEHVRVPRRPHPVECPADDAPLVPHPAAAAARSGLRLLTFGLVILAAEFVVLVAALVVVAINGPDRTPLVVAGAIVLALEAGRAGLKWLGYRRCEPAADALQSAGWLTAARYAAVVFAIGFIGMVAPWLTGATPTESGPAGAVAAVGQVAWMLATVAEFLVLLAWFRLLNELDGPAAARRVSVYTATFAFAVLTVAAGVCLATLLTAAALGRPPEPPHLLGDLPPEGLYALGGVVVLIAAFAVILGWQYYRILTAIRSGLSRP